MEKRKCDKSSQWKQLKLNGKKLKTFIEEIKNFCIFNFSIIQLNKNFIFLLSKITCIFGQTG